jgi:hypothetical protein
MITGAHFLLYSTNAEADRAFIRDVLEFRSVELDDGWLIFALPPSELGVHPSEAMFAQDHAGAPLLGAVLYLMCDDLDAFVRRLASKHVACAPPIKAEWGTSTSFPLPSGGRIGVYQAAHRTAI